MQFSSPAIASSSNPTGGFIDSVLNPVDTNPVDLAAGQTVDLNAGQIVNVDPGSTIKTVTTFVPVNGRDFFYWPSVSGEQWAPSLGNASYAGVQNIPCYAQITASGSVTFPVMARVNQKTNKSNITITFLWFLPSAFAAGNSQPIFHYGNVMLWANSANAAQYQLVTQQGVVKATLNSPSLNTWHSVEIDIATNGDTTLKIDGAQVAFSAAMFPTTQNMDSFGGTAPTFGGSTGGGTTQRWSQLEFIWS